MPDPVRVPDRKLKIPGIPGNGDTVKRLCQNICPLPANKIVPANLFETKFPSSFVDNLLTQPFVTRHLKVIRSLGQLLVGMQACQLGIRDVGQTGPVAGLVEPYLGLISLASLVESLGVSQTQFSQP